jgi:N,N'-diacetyllegionaminate synthase
MNYPLLRSVKSTGIKIYLAVGGSSKEEIKKALEILGSDNIVLLSGFQAEPNILEDLELDKISQLVKKFNLPVGYADHIDPASSLSIALPAIAVIKGASVIEKHLTIERDHLQLEDYVSALNPVEFLQMVTLIRQVEQLPVTQEYILSNREQDYRKRTKRSIVLCEELNQGDILKEEQLQLLRTGETGDFYDMNEVVGKKINKTMKSGDILKKEDIA